MLAPMMGKFWKWNWFQSRMSLSVGGFPGVGPSTSTLKTQKLGSAATASINDCCSALQGTHQVADCDSIRQVHSLRLRMTSTATGASVSELASVWSWESRKPLPWTWRRMLPALTPEGPAGEGPG